MENFMEKKNQIENFNQL